MLVLGIDAALQSGWALVDPESMELVDSGLTVNPTDRARAIESVWQSGGPDLVAVELSLFGSKRVVASLGRSTGRWLELVESRFGITESDTCMLSPTDWRKALGAPSRFVGQTDRERRASAKIWTISWAKTNLGGVHDNISDDEADAAGVAVAAYHLLHGTKHDTVPTWTLSRSSRLPRRGGKISRGKSRKSNRSATKSSATKRPRKKRTT